MSQAFNGSVGIASNMCVPLGMLEVHANSDDTCGSGFCANLDGPKRTNRARGGMSQNVSIA